MASTSAAPPLKRKATVILVDPDIGKAIEDAKKPKIDLNATKKFACISAIVDMYVHLLNAIFRPKRSLASDSMETDESYLTDNDNPDYNITSGSPMKHFY
ncbi:hypothetical protein B5X24_HaOG207099 [Helicoverpa armigera]|uniref:Uncharacterized protein n=1 Tax=Helicoverpa armigera TaxID=29058 RepID=A0A2W1BMI6_HELAM|nr:hypothetical protein B5X24_HaOG207099 [Helicoverpa armigera]